MHRMSLLDPISWGNAHNVGETASEGLYVVAWEARLSSGPVAPDREEYNLRAILARDR
jgi:hypothetical protein